VPEVLVTDGRPPRCPLDSLPRVSSRMLLFREIFGESYGQGIEKWGYYSLYGHKSFLFASVKVREVSVILYILSLRSLFIDNQCKLQVVVYHETSTR